MAREGVVNSEGLKVRITAPYGKVVEELKKGDRVTILADKWTDTAKWFQVRTASGLDGFAAAKFINVVRVIPDVPSPGPADETEDEHVLAPFLIAAGIIAVVMLALFGCLL